MTKKIGILTFHNAINYGAVFQALALQTFIEQQNGYDVKIIDLTTEDHLRGLKPITLSSPDRIKDIVLKAWNALFYFKIKRRNCKFIKFKEEKLHLSKFRYQNAEEIEKSDEKFDIYISGSDQVFHPRIKNSDAYYLNFKKGEGKRIAYAPSFGVGRISYDETKRITPWVKNFDFLSCREEEGSEILSTITHRAVPIVCDPVFLPDDSFWQSMAPAGFSVSEKYIFMFDLNGGQNLATLARNVASRTGLPIICASFNILSRYRNIKKLYDLGPLEWLQLMKYAEYVITDSFHGSAIGLRLGRKVLTYIAMPSASTRLKTLFSELSIEDQLIDDINNFEFSNVRFVDYYDKLKTFTTKSKKYLIDAIND